MEKFSVAPTVGRMEDPRLLTGRGCYAADWNFPNQAHAVFLRSDRAHARIRSIDTSEALAQPGVLAVLTAEDFTAAGYRAIPAANPVANRTDTKIYLAQRSALADGTVRFVGDCVACVVAETASIAQDALELIQVDYDDLPAVTTAHEALAAGAPQLHAGTPGNKVLDYNVGDKAATDAAFARAARVVRIVIDNPRQVGTPMEPRSCAAVWDAATDHTTVYCPTQGVGAQRSTLSRITGVPEEKLDVVAADVGGGFGGRHLIYPEYCVVTLATRKLGRPVKWTGTRSESFLADDHSRDTISTGEVAMDESGRFLAMRFHFLHNLGAYTAPSGVVVPIGSVLACLTGLYDLSTVHAQVELALTNTTPTGAYRGAGRPIMSHIIERLVDEAAAVTGIDPAELRRRNFVPKDAFPYKAAHGTVYDCGDFEGVLNDALKAADWKGFDRRRAESAARGKLRGRGIATYIEATGPGMGQEEVRMEIDADGNIIVYAAAQSQGQGYETSFAQVIAGTLGIPMERILVRSGKLGVRVPGNGSGGSRTMLGAGSVCRIAALAMVDKGKALAADALEASASDIEFEAGEYRIAGTDRKIGLMELIQRHAGAPTHPLDTTGAGAFGSTYPNSCHIAEVEIDPETGIPSIASYTAVDDFGNIINHQLVAGQLHGGTSAGVGYVLGEYAVYDAGGQLLTGSYMDYSVPRAASTVRPVMHDHPVPTAKNLLGAKGVGESGTTGSVPTFASAVMSALRQAGVSHFDMPATPQRLWRAIAEAKAGRPATLAVAQD